MDEKEGEVKKGGYLPPAPFLLPSLSSIPFLAPFLLSYLPSCFLFFFPVLSPATVRRKRRKQEEMEKGGRGGKFTNQKINVN